MSFGNVTQRRTVDPWLTKHGCFGRIVGNPSLDPIKEELPVIR